MWKSQVFSLLFAYASIQVVSPAALPRRTCSSETRILNDCNWCFCDGSHNFRCTSRDCKSVDMFGHFTDTVQEINVGMEGHGSWRSSQTACEAGVHYRRNAVLCVCNEDGNWPSPVCRDLFQILHAVEPTTLVKPAQDMKCTPTKLYLVGCNVCFCPSKGFLDPELCTTKTCDKDDPVLLHNIDLQHIAEKETEETVAEVYAECNFNVEYNLGCKTCTCLRNNRLLCDNCTDGSKSKVIGLLSTSFCSNRENGEIFNYDCNQCFCDKYGNAFCTTRKCISGPTKNFVLSYQEGLPQTDLVLVNTPFDAFGCVPGTKFKSYCNYCNCVVNGGEKLFSCSLTQCSTRSDALSKLKNDCVEGTVYEANCLICSCNVVHGVKWQHCHVNKLCIDKRDDREDKNSQDLESLHGYCEPLHVYKKDCNICRCLSDGKIVQCTTKQCDKLEKPHLSITNDNNDDHTEISKNNDKNAITVDIIPVKVENGEKCQLGVSYKIDCNFCYCLKNGNALCTTNVCN